MKKKISIKFLEGGALLQISKDTNTQMFVYPFCKYSQSEIKDEKFYVPTSQEIFNEVSDDFKVLKRSYSETKYEVSVRKFKNGHYITISQGNKTIREFVTESLLDIAYSILLKRLLEVLFFPNSCLSENSGKEMEFEIFS